MPPTRLITAHVLILGVLLASAYDIVTRQEHWPFSNYPMFSSVHKEPVLRWPRLFGVTADGDEYVILQNSELAPLDLSRLPIGLRTIYRQNGSGERLHAALAGVLKTYEQRRRAGQHEGPPLQGLRLYLVSWPLEASAANIDSPDSRQLLAEARSLR